MDGKQIGRVRMAQVFGFDSAMVGSLVRMECWHRICSMRRQVYRLTVALDAGV